MVKNTKGGNKSKGFARKSFNTTQTYSIRVPTDPLEQFAVVNKMYGTICDVTTHDLNTFKCHIRGKFRGRSKRNSIVSVGKLVMIGFRDFEAPHFKNCDLLEIYDSNDINQLLNKPDLNIRSLISLSHNLSNPISHDSSLSLDFHFSSSPHDPSIHSTLDSSIHSTHDSSIQPYLEPYIDFQDI